MYIQHLLLSIVVLGYATASSLYGHDECSHGNLKKCYNKGKSSTKCPKATVECTIGSAGGAVRCTNGISTDPTVAPTCTVKGAVTTCTCSSGKITVGSNGIGIVGGKKLETSTPLTTSGLDKNFSGNICWSWKN